MKNDIINSTVELVEIDDISRYINSKISEFNDGNIYIEKSDEVLLYPLSEITTLSNIINENTYIYNLRLFNKDKEVYLWRYKDSYKARERKDSDIDGEAVEIIDNASPLVPSFNTYGNKIIGRSYVNKNKDTGFIEIDDFRLVEIIKENNNGI